MKSNITIGIYCSHITCALNCLLYNVHKFMYWWRNNKLQALRLSYQSFTVICYSSKNIYKLVLQAHNFPWNSNISHLLRFLITTLGYLPFLYFSLLFSTCFGISDLRLSSTCCSRQIIFSVLISPTLIMLFLYFTLLLVLLSIF